MRLGPKTDVIPFLGMTDAPHAVKHSGVCVAICACRNEAPGSIYKPPPHLEHAFEFAFEWQSVPAWDDTEDSVCQLWCLVADVLSLRRIVFLFCSSVAQLKLSV
ncbi:hypothetical protein HNY73_014590 [Argiope bruennichi]|uniref:Uncharacterized protein n=1 Tax=Argiope bruennichi TaxID=94029 RepID=A0A8T0ER85_ARGBR|nr:hypothetical protein HNY73_014590 [Argiope bruennichi]